MKDNFDLTEEDWRHLMICRDCVSRKIAKRLPRNWHIPKEDIDGAVLDSIINLISIYRPGGMSLVTWCYKWAESYTVRNLQRDHYRAINQISISPLPDPTGEIRHETGFGDVPALTVDGRNSIIDHAEVACLSAIAGEDDRRIMQGIMDGKAYGEIAAEMGLSDKKAITRHMRRYAR